VAKRISAQEDSCKSRHGGKESYYHYTQRGSWKFSTGRGQTSGKRSEIKGGSPGKAKKGRGNCWVKAEWVGARVQQGAQKYRLKTTTLREGYI